jgi:broad specificity phosphatase PhoE
MFSQERKVRFHAKMDLDWVCVGRPMKIYFVRHGEATHNASFLIRQSESAYRDPAHRDAILTTMGH